MGIIWNIAAKGLHPRFGVVVIAGAKETPHCRCDRLKRLR